MNSGDTLRKQSAISLQQLSDSVRQRQLHREPHLCARVGVSVERIPVGSLEEADEDASFARDALRQLASIPTDALDHSDALTHAFLCDMMTRWREWPELWWAQFPVTPYVLSGHNGLVRSAFEAFDFTEADAADRYPALLQAYGRSIEGLRNKLEIQAQGGWRIPRPALPGVRIAIDALESKALQVLLPSAQRLAPVGSRVNALRTTIQQLLENELGAAFRRLRADLGTEYLGQAPDPVGLSQYPGGESLYRRVACQHASFAIDPAELHRQGLASVAEISAAMQTVRASLGFPGPVAEFLEHMKRVGRLYARTPEDVEQRYRHHMSRIAGVVERYFSCQPAAPYDVARLDPAMEPGLSFGFYEPPSARHPVGRYRYNGSGLESRPQISAAALIFHELVPGHHFHLARQAENKRLPEVRRESLDITADVEGWAEYASDLAREMGLYDDPYDLYGRLVLDRFAAQRIVLDTGLNLLGWSLDRARAYMKENTLESDAQIASETLRYATDLPGQALAYRLGLLKFKALREHAQSALGAQFDTRAYHETILSAGALPLSVLEDHVQWFIGMMGHRVNTV